MDSMDSGGQLIVSPDRPLHSNFGEGKVVDILLWRNKKISAAFLVGFTVIWFLFEAMECNFITLMSNILVWIMVFLFVWSKGAGLIGWDPPDLQEITIPESTFQWLCEKLNSLLLKFYDISSGKDWKSLFLAITIMWMLSIIGNIFSSFNWLYIGFLCLMTFPALFETYQNEVQYQANKAITDMIHYARNMIGKFLPGLQEGM